ncbi:hypothetical protein ABID65_004199 [Bradyrhizobium sp. S3.9.2]
MTTPPRDRVTRLIVALAVTSAIMTSAIMTSAIMTSAIILPRAARAEDGQFDKMRARIAAFVADKMEKLGGSRIVYKVDTGGLRESVVTTCATMSTRPCARARSPSPVLRSATPAWR